MSVDGEDYHLGYSRISSYVQCPRQYKYNYIDRIGYKSGIPARKGSAYHNTLEVMLKHKMEEDGDLLPPDVCDKLAVFKSRAEELTEKQTHQVIDAVRFYYETQYPVHQPALVEDTFRIERGGVVLTGRIDLYEQTGVVVDHKFSSNLWTPPRAQYGVQPMIYQWAGFDYIAPKTGIEYTGFEYNIIRMWPKPLIQQITIPVLSQWESDWWEEQVSAIANAIRAGNFPATPSDTTCGFCSYRKICNPPVYEIQIDMIGDSDEE